MGVLSRIFHYSISAPRVRGGHAQGNRGSTVSHAWSPCAACHWAEWPQRVDANWVVVAANSAVVPATRLRQRLRRGSQQGRRSFSEGGKQGPITTGGSCWNALGLRLPQQQRLWLWILGRASLAPGRQLSLIAPPCIAFTALSLLHY